MSKKMLVVEHLPALRKPREYTYLGGWGVFLNMKNKK